MIKFKKEHKEAVIPTIAHEGDAGHDLYCTEDIEIGFDEQLMIDTKISCAIPEGWVGLIRPRSGLAANHRLDIRAGVVDAPYRDTIKVLIVNECFRPYKFKKGDRIAQMVVVPFMAESKEVEELDDTERGKKGIGSTGK